MFARARARAQDSPAARMCCRPRTGAHLRLRRAVIYQQVQRFAAAHVQRIKIKRGVLCRAASTAGSGGRRRRPGLCCSRRLLLEQATPAHLLEQLQAQHGGGLPAASTAAAFLALGQRCWARIRLPPALIARLCRHGCYLEAGAIIVRWGAVLLLQKGTSCRCAGTAAALRDLALCQQLLCISRMPRLEHCLGFAGNSTAAARPVGCRAKLAFWRRAQTP